MNPTRRQFLAAGSFAAMAQLSGATQILANSSSVSKPKFIYFTKHLIGVSAVELAKITADLGFDGVEAPIRPKGHVEPERVEDELPVWVNALKEVNKEMTIITTNITEVSKETRTEEVLRTAKGVGVPNFRMGYFRYDLSQPILPQLQEWKAKLKDLIQLCEEIGITPLYQNHSGKDYFGAPIWDLHQIMKDYTPKQFGMAFDIYHTTVEGSASWPIEVALMKPHVGAWFIKSFKWGEKRAEACSLLDGWVKPEQIKAMRDLQLEVPVCLHVEYLKGSLKDSGYLQGAIDATKRDFEILKQWWLA